MDEVIYLEQDEEITSVIDKLKSMPDAKSVALVVPKSASILQSVVNLKILKKEAEVLDKELALITKDKIGRNLASQVGLSVYDNANLTRPIIQTPKPEPQTTEVIELDMSEKRPIKPPHGVQVHHYDEGSINRFRQEEKKEQEISSEPITHVVAKPLSAEDYQIPQVGKPKPPIKKRLLKWLAIFGLLVLSITLFYFYYPKAIITFTLNTEPYEKAIEIQVDNSISKPDEAKNSIPGELQEVENEISEDFPATGEKNIGERAKGTITLTNGTGDPQLVGEGTEVRSKDGLTFYTTSGATIPKATASVDSSGNVVKTSGSTDVFIEAGEPGENYNIGATSWSIPTNSKIAGSSTESMSGGITKKLKIISQDDINNAKSELVGKLTSDNHQALTNKAGKQKILEATIKDEVVSSQTDKEVDTQTDSFKMTVKLKSRTLSFLEDDYREMIVKVLEQEIPENKSLILASDDEISTTGSETDFSIGIIKLTGTVKTRLSAKIDDSQIRSQIANESEIMAEEKLKGISGVESVDVFLRPSWWLKKIPKLERNIEIKREYK